MKVYLQEEFTTTDWEYVMSIVLKAPPYVLVKVNKVCLNDDVKVYQVLVYCFDDEYDLSAYED